MWVVATTNRYALVIAREVNPLALKVACTGAAGAGWNDQAIAAPAWRGAEAVKHLCTTPSILLLTWSGAAMAESLRAFSSWFLRIECDRCVKVRMVNETHVTEAQRGLTLRDFLVQTTTTVLRRPRAAAGC